MNKVFLLYKCQCCDTVFEGAESDLTVQEVIHGMQEGWFDAAKLHSCETTGKHKFGISKLVGVSEN